MTNLSLVVRVITVINEGNHGADDNFCNFLLHRVKGEELRAVAAKPISVNDMLKINSALKNNSSRVPPLVECDNPTLKMIARNENLARITNPKYY